MASSPPSKSLAPNDVKLLLLAYGIGRGYRVLTFEEIAQAHEHVSRQVIRQGLDQLAAEDLVSRFAGRYCFNKPIPTDLLRDVEHLVTASGTVRLP